MSKILLEEQAAPSTPGTSTVAIYPKSDGRLYSMDDGGSELPLAGLKIGNVTTMTSGTSLDFTGLPDGLTKVYVIFVGLQFSSTGTPIIRLGTSSGIISSGYASYANAGAALTSYTTAFLLNYSSANTHIHRGVIGFTRQTSTDNTWAIHGASGRAIDNQISISGGVVALTARLTQLRLTTSSGSDTFSAGTINIVYG